MVAYCLHFFKSVLRKNKKSISFNHASFLINYNSLRGINSRVIYLKTVLTSFFFILPVACFFIWFTSILESDNRFIFLKRLYKKNGLSVDLIYFKAWSLVFQLQNYYIYHSIFFFIMGFFVNKFFFFQIGLSDSLEVTGYSRRSWFSKNKKFLCLRVGKSFINRILIPKKVLLILARWRFINFYSISKRLLSFFSYTVHALRPADKYKGAGLKLKSKNLILKERFVKK